MPRSIYVPLEADEVESLAAMAKQSKRNTHDQAAYLITQALDRWRAERAFEASLQGEELEGVA